MRIDRRLLLIFLLAFFLRFIFLSDVPSGFHNDEVDLGYVGKYLVLHGVDPAGNVLPLSFDKFGDFRPIGLFWLSGISQIIFGSGEFAVRFPTALLGALSVFGVFLVANFLFKRREIGYFSAFFLAVLPWHIVLSRAAHEAIAGYLLVLFGIYFFLKFLEGKNARKYLIYSLALIFGSYFFYHGIRVLVPLLLLPFFVVFKDRRALKFFGLFLLLTFLIIISPWGKGRLSQVVFYKNPGILKKIEELPFADKGNVKAARIFHNKPVVYTRELVGNYLQYFSSDFLFMRGGLPERYLVVETGLIFLVLGGFGLLGFVRLFSEKRGLIVVSWIFLSPLPAVLTYEDIPSATRASFLMFPLVLTAALGFVWALDSVRKGIYRKVLVFGFFVVLALEMTFFAHQYLVHQKSYKGVLRDEGAKEIAKYIGQKQGEYDQIVANFGPNLPFYFLFFNGNFEKVNLDISDKNADFQYENVLFVRDPCPSHRIDKYTGKILFIDEPNCDNRPNRREVFRVMREDLTMAFGAYVVEN